MIEKLASYIARKIKEMEGDESTSNVNVMAYALGGYLNTFIIVATTLIVTLSTNSILKGTVAIIGFAVLRRFSGGFHFRSLDLCAIVTVSLFVVAAHVEISQFFVYLLTVLSFVILLFKSPNYYAGTGPSGNLKSLYKLYSSVIVLLNIFLLSSTLSFVFFAQSALLLIPRIEEVKYDA